jgi:hypothetical protein
VEAADAGRPVEASALAMRALDSISASDGQDAAGWQIPAIANGLADHGGAQAAEQLFQRALWMAEMWSEDSLQPLFNLSGARVDFLISRAAGEGETLAAIERYRALLIAAHGPESGLTGNALRKAIDLQRRHPAPLARRPAEVLVEFQERINGNTSAPYLDALKTLAQIDLANGDFGAELRVRRQIVEIADQVSPDSEPERAQARVDAAMAFAHLGDFDAADRLAQEADSLGKKVTPAPGVSFDGAIQQIRELRAASAQPRIGVPER